MTHVDALSKTPVENEKDTQDNIIEERITVPTTLTGNVKIFH